MLKVSPRILPAGRKQIVMGNATTLSVLILQKRAPDWQFAALTATQAVAAPIFADRKDCCLNVPFEFSSPIVFAEMSGHQTMV